MGFLIKSRISEIFVKWIRINQGVVCISSTSNLKISSEYILKYLNGSQNRDVVVSFATVQDQTCFDCFFLLTSAVVTGPLEWFWNWLGLVFRRDIYWINTRRFINTDRSGGLPFCLSRTSQLKFCFPNRTKPMLAVTSTFQDYLPQDIRDPV